MLPLALAVLLSLHGLRRRSLSPSGALAAFIVGLATMSGALYVFGVALIVFYLLGSRATKYGKKRKASLEAGYHEAGYRTAFQVFCNSFGGLLAVTAWNAYYVPDSIHAKFLRAISLDSHLRDFLRGSRYRIQIVEDFAPSAWCAIDARHDISRALIFAALGHFACCLGDTLASELGILSGSQPRLITTLKPVPPGTNGGMSLGGTLSSIVGGAVIGVTMGTSLAFQNVACRSMTGGTLAVIIEMAKWGALAGGFGSLIDSFFGAIVQRTRYSTKDKLILTDESSDTQKKDIKVISGWNILTNNQVNLLSSTITTIALMKLA